MQQPLLNEGSDDHSCDAGARKASVAPRSIREVILLTAALTTLVLVLITSSSSSSYTVPSQDTPVRLEEYLPTDAGDGCDECCKSGSCAYAYRGDPGQCCTDGQCCPLKQNGYKEWNYMYLGQNLYCKPLVSGKKYGCEPQPWCASPGEYRECIDSSAEQCDAAGVPYFYRPVQGECCSLDACVQCVEGSSLHCKNTSNWSGDKQPGFWDFNGPWNLFGVDEKCCTDANSVHCEKDVSESQCIGDGWNYLGNRICCFSANHQVKTICTAKTEDPCLGEGYSLIGDKCCYAHQIA